MMRGRMGAMDLTHNKKINKYIFLFGLLVVIYYLTPLLMHPLYVSIFDNLDSTIPSLNILAHSGKIFAANNAIIPNMMNGLPRSTYGSEFNVILWLYYFFDPKTAYIVNQILIHIVAYIAMFVFLRAYIVPRSCRYRELVVLIGSLYFALIPFFSPEGLSIPLLPLATYSLLNIKNGNDTKWDWIFLILIPFYSSFVFVYVFYIVLAGLYLVWDTVYHRKLNTRFLWALILFGTIFLCVEYRLLLSMFIEKNFVSHRTEFDIFFNFNTMDSYRGGHVFFLNGHHQHLIDIQAAFVLPVILIGMLLSLSKRRFSKNESMLIWILILLSFVLEFWPVALGQLYSMPVLTIVTLIVYLFTKYTKAIPLLMLLQIILAAIVFLSSCQCLHSLTHYIPILKMLNISRIAFVQPLIWAILLAYVLPIYLQRLRYSFYFLLLFISAQIILSLHARNFSNKPVDGLASFSGYYAPQLFARIKQDLPKHNVRVVSFGFEPAVALYNGLYTVDGYTTDYPLSYKHRFRKVIEKYISKMKDTLYDRWGSKVYLMQIRATPDIYKHLKGKTIEKTLFNTKALCSLHTDYLLSAYKIDLKNREDLVFVKYYKGKKGSWDVYLYRLNCGKPRDPSN